MKTQFKTFFLVSIFVGISSLQAQQSDSPYLLSDQLFELADQHQFEIRGINVLAETEQRRAQKINLETRLQQLLEGFNYALVRDDNQQIKRLIIIKKGLNTQKTIILDTIRRNRQHLVNVSLQGQNNAWIDVELLIDTGADRIVIPSSLMTELGYQAEQMTDSKLQTANGILAAKTGTLKAVSLGNQIINDIDIAFVEDQLLGNVMLLGMNVLSQYRMILDDELNQITLIAK